MKGLMLHCGANAVTLDEVEAVNTPAFNPATGWTPVPHHKILEEVRQVLSGASQFHVKEEAHSLSHDGDRYFGLMTMESDVNMEGLGYEMACAIRNTHDKSFAAGLVLGARVFVCDNLCFSGEVRFDRKHTRHILRDLPGMVQRAIGKVGELRIKQNQRFDTYRKTGLDDKDAHDLIVRAIDAKVIPAQKVPNVLKEWREPEHEEFQERNIWSLYNGFTEVLKQYSAGAVADRCLRLNPLTDRFCGLEYDYMPSGEVAKTAHVVEG